MAAPLAMSVRTRTGSGTLSELRLHQLRKRWHGRPTHSDRQVENRFARDLGSQGQAALATYEQLSLPEIKADKDAAAARLRAAGADAVLSVRLVDQTTYSRDVRATPERWAPTVSGYGTYHWHDFYSAAYVDMGTTWGSTRQKIYLDTCLFDLKTGQRLWSALTLTVLTDDSDRLAEADSLVAKVVHVMRQDGVVR